MFKSKNNDNNCNYNFSTNDDIHNVYFNRVVYTDNIEGKYYHVEKMRMETKHKNGWWNFFWKRGTLMNWERIWEFQKLLHKNKANKWGLNYKLESEEYFVKEWPSSGRLLLAGSSRVCGAVLLSARAALTAAACVYFHSVATDFTLVLGDTHTDRSEGTEQTVQVSLDWMHFWM